MEELDLAAMVDVAFQLVLFARVLSELRRLPEAADVARRAYTSARRFGEDRVVDLALLTRASIARQLGDIKGAARLLAEVEPRLRRSTVAGDVTFATLASEQALVAQARGDSAAALDSADRALGIAEARELVAALEQPVLAPVEFVGDEGGDEIEGHHLLGLRLPEPRVQDGGHAGQPQLPERAIEFDEIHDGSPVVRSMRSR